MGTNCGVAALMCKQPIIAPRGCRGDPRGTPCPCHTPSHAKTSAPQRRTWCPCPDVLKEEKQGFGVGWVTQGEKREVGTVVLGSRETARNALNCLCNCLCFLFLSVLVSVIRSLC